ncbi:putative aldouronate transport system substrate-binding protein [Paenibacillus taihuensis]|uniref:Putative aldouronate transport system substrate-binding protein n=1 Tax=Paenibacillus taihuensis TaxID=1156355 RepID=A0A3D9R2V9_9BACL|nr:ABC transporter substrate-binding protein [Paenibacillus taihuensis]REE69645.1 putative aldouronate transport system substrate-binding protein [Paenibacillus taihuensis]
MRRSNMLTLFLPVVLSMAIALTGCGGNNSGNSKADSSNGGNTKGTTDNAAADNTAAKSDIDLSKHVNLNMYLIGSPAKDYDMVLAEVNKKLEKDLNATLTVNWVGWADYGTQYPLLLASGEPIDLIYASTWTNFYSNARKGAFMAIEDLAKKYAPKSLAQITPDFYTQTEVDGHLYAMPAEFYQYGDMGYIVRGDLMKKYGLTAINNIDDYGKYMDAVVKNDPQLDPSGQISSSGGLETYYASSKGYYNILSSQFTPFYVNMDDPSAKIFNLYESDGILDYFKKMKEWGDKGYWSKSILSNKDDKMFKEEKSASILHNQDSWSGAYMEHPDWDVQFYLNSKYTYKTQAMQDGMAVPASSKNPERALMFLELLRTDRSYNNLLTYGIEGKHYEITADNKLRALDLDGFAPDGYCSWGFKAPELRYEVVDSPPNIGDVRKALADRAKENPYALFTPDFEPVKNEMAAVTNVVQQYSFPLNYGYVKNPEEGLKTLVSKIKAAGSEKIMAEMQKQLDAFIAANKSG